MNQLYALKIGIIVLLLTASCLGLGTKDRDISIRDYLASGKKWFDKGELDLALVDYNAAVRKYPDHFAPYHARAWVWLEKGEIKKAEEDFIRAIKLAPDFGPAYRGRSHVYELQGRLPGAIADMKRFVELEPEDVEGRDRLKRLEARYSEYRPSFILEAPEFLNHGQHAPETR